MIYTIAVDDKTYKVSDTTIKNYPQSSLYQVLYSNDMEFDDADYDIIQVEDGVIYLDLDKTSVDILIGYMRGYTIDFSNIKLSLIEKVCRDAMLLGLHKLSDDLQDYLPINKQLINCDEIFDMTKTVSATLMTVLSTMESKPSDVLIDVGTMITKYLSTSTFRELIKTLTLNYDMTYREYHVLNLSIKNLFTVVLIFIEQLSVKIFDNKNPQLDELTDYMKDRICNADCDLDDDSLLSMDETMTVARTTQRIDNLQHMITDVSSVMMNMLNNAEN
jgi:hypothetical protein